MNRREFLRGAAVTTAVSVVSTGYAASGQAKKPHVLILMSDQHKRSCMGAYGDKVANTPTLDRLAGESVRFTNAYCTNPAHVWALECVNLVGLGRKKNETLGVRRSPSVRMIPEKRYVYRPHCYADCGRHHCLDGRLGTSSGFNLPTMPSFS
jgi:Sulfatase